MTPLNAGEFLLKTEVFRNDLISNIGSVCLKATSSELTVTKCGDENDPDTNIVWKIEEGTIRSKANEDTCITHGTTDNDARTKSCDVNNEKSYVSIIPFNDNGNGVYQRDSLISNIFPKSGIQLYGNDNDGDEYASFSVLENILLEENTRLSFKFTADEMVGNEHQVCLDIEQVRK